jgi:hypothetical protein
MLRALPFHVLSVLLLGALPGVAALSDSAQARSADTRNTLHSFERRLESQVKLAMPSSSTSWYHQAPSTGSHVPGVPLERHCLLLCLRAMI